MVLFSDFSIFGGVVSTEGANHELLLLLLDVNDEPGARGKLELPKSSVFIGAKLELVLVVDELEELAVELDEGLIAGKDATPLSGGNSSSGTNTGEESAWRPRPGVPDLSRSAAPGLLLGGCWEGTCWY